MISLRVGELREAWWVRGAAAAVALLALAAGVCVFDQDGGGAGGRGTPLDLCLALLAVSLAVMPLVRLEAGGWAVSLPLAGAYDVALYSSDPPPKPASPL